MKFIVLGGAGDMGSRAVEDLAVSDGVERVTIADRNVSVAKKIAERLKNSKPAVDVKEVDANNHASLVEAMRGYDVAASALGPFHLFEAKLVRAAIDAGVDYVSVCDEWEPAETVMNEFTETARQKNRIILTGLGASPGLTNVGVRHLVNQFERAKKVDIYCYQPLDAGGGEAVFRHMLHIITGEITVWKNGKRTVVPACSESRVIEFPKFGRVRLWNMGHSEPVTIPRFIPGIEECNFFMGFGRGSGLFITPAKLGAFKSKRGVDAAIKLMLWAEKKTKGLPVRVPACRAAAQARRTQTGAEPAHGALRMDVTGTINGKEETKMICGTGQMREVTGLALSIGAQMLACKQLLTTQGGVYAPEAILDPVSGISHLRSKGIEAFEDLAMQHRVEI